MSSDKNNFVNKKLGGIVEIDVKLKMPQAFVDYINELAIKQKEYAKDIGEYCNDEVLQGMITHLEGDKDIHLKNTQFLDIFHMQMMRYDILQ